MEVNTSVTRKVTIKQGKRVVRQVVSVDSEISTARSLQLLEKSLNQEFGKGNWTFDKEFL